MLNKDIWRNSSENIRKLVGRVKVSCSRKKLVISSNEKNIRYKDLGPKDISKEDSEYFRALDWAFNNEQIYNIAIAGPYGSGKSSIINSYIKKHPELKAVNISLANFLALNKSNNIDTNDDIELELEIGILKQLFYKVDHKKIPQSRYRKLYPVKRKKIALVILFLIGFGYLLLRFLYNDIGMVFENHIKIASDNYNCTREWVFAIGIILLAVSVRLVTELIWLALSKIHVKEINFSDHATATTEKGTDESIFNKNMDEIVYFFEVTGYKAVFIEDLDRFNRIDIFVKLRELNTILNNYENIKKRIVFIYAVRDDMFLNEERTKFFEFILPVIPYITSTNSSEILLERIEKDKEIYHDLELDVDFIEMVGPYISDMRILDNIYNEFITYKKILQGSGNAEDQKLNLKDKFMMSLMIFKNIYPKDFAQLQSGSGIVQHAFLSKRDFWEAKRNELEEKKKAILERMEMAQKDVLESQQEVKMAMMFQMTDRKGMLKTVQLDGRQYSFSKILTEDFDISTIEKIGLIEYWPDGSAYTRNITFDKNNWDKIESYKQRCKNIVFKLPEIKEDYRKQIEEIDNEIRRLGSLTLKEILCTYQTEKILPEDVEENKLLVFMLRNGFVDEKYPNHINYFYENSLTRDDMNFILNVRNHDSMEFGYPLTQVTQVIKNMRLFEFEQKEALNFSLLDVLLENSDYLEKRDQLLKQLSDETELCWRFINEYIDKAKNPDLFVAVLTKFWKNMWNYIYDSQILTEERKDKYLNLICNNAEIKDIIDLNGEGKLQAYFVEKKDILKRIIGVPADRMKGIIEECDIVFQNFNTDVCNEELLNWIFDERHFDVNIEMIQCIFGRKKPEAMENLLKRNYTEIRELEYYSLPMQIYLNISQYIENVFLKLEANTEESLESVLDLLKRVEEVEHACEIIQKENVVLDDLNNCYSEVLQEEPDSIKQVWNAWIKNQKLEVNWDNLFKYWGKFGVTDELLFYIEYGIGELERDTCPESVDLAFVNEIIRSDLEEQYFSRFMNCVPEINYNIKLNLINKSHVKILILKKCFEFSHQFAKNVKQIHPDLYVLTLLTNYESVFENPQDYVISSDELEQILNSEMIDDTVKIRFIEQKAAIPYSSAIASYLRNVSCKLTKEIYWNAWEALEENQRYALFLNQIQILSEDDISECFKELGEEYQKFADRAHRHDEKLYDNEYNRKLVEYLKKITYITSFKEEFKEVWDENSRRMNRETWLRCRIKQKG